MARRNPSRRSRLTPGEEGELGGKAENLAALKEWAQEDLSQEIFKFCLESRQNEQSWSNIRKALKFAVGKIVKHAVKKIR